MSFHPLTETEWADIQAQFSKLFGTIGSLQRDVVMLRGEIKSLRDAVAHGTVRPKTGNDHQLTARRAT